MLDVTRSRVNLERREGIPHGQQLATDDEVAKQTDVCSSSDIEEMADVQWGFWHTATIMARSKDLHDILIESRTKALWGLAGPRLSLWWRACEAVSGLV